MECVMSKHCKACGRVFRPHPQVPDQTYCSAPECQRERRRRWQQQKRREDPHYRENDADHHKAWAAANASYWKRYREMHPDYTDRNRSLQQDRNRRQAEAGIANEDASTVVSPFQSGRYRLVLVTAAGIANEDVWIVEITVISSVYDNSGE
jgi:hypothetical protein